MKLLREYQKVAYRLPESVIISAVSDQLFNKAGQNLFGEILIMLSEKLPEARADILLITVVCCVITYPDRNSDTATLDDLEYLLQNVALMHQPRLV